MRQRPKKPEGILIPENVIEALLVALSTGDRSSATNVANEIKRMAEDQKPDKFKTHRHGK